MWRFGFVLFLCSTILATFTYILHQPQLRLDRIIISPTQTVETDVVDQAVDLFFTDQPRLIPQDSILLSQRARLAQHLLDIFPTFEQITIKRKDFSDLTIVITEHEFRHLVREGTKWFVANSSGYIYAQTDQPTNEPIFISTLPDDSIEVRGRMYSGGDLMAFDALLGDLDDLGLEVQRIYFKNDLETILELENQVQLIIPTYDNHARVVETLREILTYKEFQYDFSQGSFGTPIDYINLRYGERILYCYRDDVCQGSYDF